MMSSKRSIIFKTIGTVSSFSVDGNSLNHLSPLKEYRILFRESFHSLLVTVTCRCGQSIFGLAHLTESDWPSVALSLSLDLQAKLRPCLILHLQASGYDTGGKRFRRRHVLQNFAAARRRPVIGECIKA
jgi:hypothetical protein